MPAPALSAVRRLVLFGESHRLRKEELALSQALDLPWVMASESQIARRRIVLTAGDLPVGPIGFMRAALQQFGRSLPGPNDYPASLRAFLLRDVSAGRLGRVASDFAVTGQPVFIKPAERIKRFTGFVLDRTTDYRIAGVSRSLAVWVSPVVSFVSEWRYYTSGGKVMTKAAAIPGKEPDHAVVFSALEAWSDGPAGAALDFGVLADGRTALVEANDGWSLGMYEGADAAAYAETLAARWRQLVT